MPKSKEGYRYLRHKGKPQLLQLKVDLPKIQTR